MRSLKTGELAVGGWGGWGGSEGVPEIFMQSVPLLLHEPTLQDEIQLI